MIKEQEIKSLIRVCTEALIEAGYTEQRILVYQKRWDRLSKYMKDHSISDYSKEVGDAFMEVISQERQSYRVGYQRCVYFLSDYLLCGKVRKKIIPIVHYELSGAVGKVATSFIETLVAMRRSKLTIYAYQRALSYFIKHLSIRNVVNPSDITGDDVLSFLASVQNCKQDILRIIHSFCRYMCEQKINEYECRICYWT